MRHCSREAPLAQGMPPILWDSHNSQIPAVQQPGHQTPTAKAPARAPGGQRTHTKTPMTLRTPCKQPAMGEETKCRQGQKQCQPASGCQWRTAKPPPGPAGAQLNMPGGRNNRPQQSSCGSEPPPQKFRPDHPEELNIGSKADSHWVIHHCLPGGKTHQPDPVNPW